MRRKRSERNKLGLAILIVRWKQYSSTCKDIYDHISKLNAYDVRERERERERGSN